MFIAIEGTEGSGKTTQAKLLYKYLKNKNINVVLTKEPGGTKQADEIRHLLLSGKKDKWLPESELCLLNAARIDHYNRFIKPHLDKNFYVICDRFFYSTIAYQGYGMGIDIKKIKNLHDMFLKNVKPNIIFTLLLEPEKSLKRAQDHNRYEKMDLDFHKRVFNGFLKLDSIFIDSDQEILKVHKKIISHID